MTESRHSFQGKPIGAGRAQTATDVGVVVVTFRSAQTIRHCLELLLASDAVVRIVVVDNASDDGTLALLDQIAGEQERITLVKNADNRGFAAACNQGASALATPWVAFVNPDCYVEPEAMLRLVLYGIDRAGAGMLGADLVDEDGVPDPAARRRDPSLRELLGQAGRRRDLYLGRDPNMDLQQVEAISGALMLMPLACSCSWAASTKRSACMSRTSTCAGERGRPATKCWSPTTSGWCTCAAFRVARGRPGSNGRSTAACGAISANSKPPKRRAGSSPCSGSDCGRNSWWPRLRVRVRCSALSRELSG